MILTKIYWHHLVKKYSLWSSKILKAKRLLFLIDHQEFSLLIIKKNIFSDKVEINYANGKEQTLEFVWDNEDFSRGDYVMEVYEKTKQGAFLIGKVTKTLE